MENQFQKPGIAPQLSVEELVHFATFLPILDQFVFFHQTIGSHYGAQPKTCNRQQQLQYDYQCYQQYNQQRIQLQQQYNQQQQQQQHQQQQLPPELSSKEHQSTQVNTGSKTTNWKNHGTM